MELASRGLIGSSRQQQRPTSTDDRGHQDAGPGENAEYAYRDRDVKRLGGGDYCEADAHACPGVGEHCPGQRERGESDAVDQAEHDQPKTEHADAGGTLRIAPSAAGTGTRAESA